MKMKFKRSLFGLNQKQIYDYIKKRDITTAEIIEKNKEELARLRRSEELVNLQIKETFPMVDNPVYLQSEEELEILQEQVEELKRQAIILAEFIEDNAVTQEEQVETIEEP